MLPSFTMRIPCQHHHLLSVFLWHLSFCLTDGLVPATTSSVSRTTPTRFHLRAPLLTRTSTNLSMAQSASSSSTDSTMTTVPSWTELCQQLGETLVGKALNQEMELRKTGHGSAHVHNTLRLFGDPQKEPSITLYRDHAGWCPYCQKTMLLVEEKQIPIRISLVNMRSYGDKPAEFLRKVPNGLLPALEVDDDNGGGRKRIITESQVIMELLDEWHAVQDGYRPMLPAPENHAGWVRYEKLARLERELFSWWCTLVFRPEGPPSVRGEGGGISNPLARLMGAGDGDGDSESTMPAMSSSMRGFLDCLQQVDQQLLSTKGPWFFDENDYPTMIDFIYVSHVERMLASCAYWKGLNLRDSKWNLKGLNAWLEAFEKREPYLAFKSDYFTHVMDIPPQYGPGFDGGFEEERNQMKRAITGRDGSWKLPLSHDDHLQPLYKGPPLPLCVLKAVGLDADPDGSYESCDKFEMESACRMMAAWKLAGNGSNVAKFAARGGPQGSKNPRKSFGAQLADPYAEPDKNVLASVDSTLRIVCQAIFRGESSTEPLANLLRKNIPEKDTAGVVSSLAYVRDRVGVPRDLPLAAARYLRAYLNWGIDALSTR